jgi:hypothetical protein
LADQEALCQEDPYLEELQADLEGELRADLWGDLLTFLADLVVHRKVLFLGAFWEEETWLLEVLREACEAAFLVVVLLLVVLPLADLLVDLRAVLLQEAFPVVDLLEGGHEGVHLADPCQVGHFQVDLHQEDL